MIMSAALYIVNRLSKKQYISSYEVSLTGFIQTLTVSSKHWLVITCSFIQLPNQVVLGYVKISMLFNGFKLHGSSFWLPQSRKIRRERFTVAVL